MALPKNSRIRYIPLKGRRGCHDECFDTRPTERKRRFYRNCVTGFLFIILMHYTYTYYWLPSEIDSPFAEMSNVDEFLTTPINDDGHAIFGFKTEDHLRIFIENTTYRTIKGRSLLPRCIKVGRFGRTHLNTSKIILSDLEEEYPMVFGGGYYRPRNCSTIHQVAIIVAYRGREKNLAIFLYNMHPILMEQQIEYQIFIVEQAGNDLFNKGRLFNAGFKEVSKLEKFRCVIFHDLDLLPAFKEIQYNCPTLPRHMSSQIDHRLVMKLGQSYQYKSLFGGVVSMTMEMMSRVNGYSNLYFGWGGEDNDMFWRLRAAGYPIVKYNKTIGIFTVLPHVRAPTNKFRHHLLARAVERYKVDGLSNIEYVVVSNTSHHLYTHLLVDINPRKQNVTELSIRWASGDNSF